MKDETNTPNQPSNLHSAVLPMLNLLVISLDGIADQLRDLGASEADAQDIEDAAGRLTARLKKLL